MPLWNIFHTSSIFTSEATRTELASAITKLYTDGGLPDFYVVVQFIPLPPTNVFVGAKTRDSRPFVRLVVEHIAVHRHEGSDGFPARFSDKIDEALKPFIKDNGYDWEISVSDTPRDFWRFNGIAPPPHRSEAEKMWVREGKPTEWASK